jgi:hypothetical protein
VGSATYIVIALAVAAVAAVAILLRKKAHDGSEPAVTPVPAPPTPAVPKGSADSPAGVPAWAAPMSEDELDDFLAQVGEHFRARGMTIEVDVKDGSAKVHHELYGASILGLSNLAAMCKQSERKHWPEVIADHFHSMELSAGETDEIEAKQSDFEQVSHLIHVKIYHPEYIAQIGPEHVVFREQMPGTVSVLVYDMPQSVRNLNPDHIKGWGKSIDELFRLGFRNVKAHYPPTIQDQLTPDNLTIKAISDNNFFNTTHALLIEHYPELIGAHGALLGVPNRGVLLAFPINDRRVLTAVQIMLIAIIGMHRDGPGSISDKLYWYRDGLYRDLPYTLDGNNLNFIPPDEFVEMLNSIVHEPSQ